MRRFVAPALVMLPLLAGVPTEVATAAPLNAAPFGSLLGGPAGVTLVAYGCGAGWTRGPYGHCHSYSYLNHHYDYHPYYHHYYYHY
jgi:hypothetical protein